VVASQLGLVALGGGIGGMARVWVSEAVAVRTGGRFPWGTLAVNTSGALLIGVLAALLGVSAADSPWGAGGAVGTPGDQGVGAWSFLAVGLLGSYTTVSSFSLQTFSLIQGREWGRAGANVALSFGLCLVGAWVGLQVGRSLFGG